MYIYKHYSPCFPSSWRWRRMTEKLTALLTIITNRLPLRLPSCHVDVDSLFLDVWCRWWISWRRRRILSLWLFEKYHRNPILKREGKGVPFFLFTAKFNSGFFCGWLLSLNFRHGRSGWPDSSCLVYRWVEKRASSFRHSFLFPKSPSKESITRRRTKDGLKS